MRPALLLALVLIASAPASAQVVARLADLRLATAVRLALVDDVRTRALDLSVAARNGDVEIEGDVAPAARRTVDEVARRVRGVRSVGGVGSLTDVPASPVAVEPRAPERPASSDRSAEVAREPERGSPARSGPVYHTVQRGDTLFSLARRYDTTVDAILDLNDRRSTDIQVGQRLRVR